MDIKVTHYHRCSIVTMSGRLDANTAPELEEALAAILQDGKHNLVFDIEGVDFISSRGIWVFLEAQKKCKKENGEVVITNVNDNVKKSLELAGVSHFIKIYPDLVSAVASF